MKKFLIIAAFFTVVGAESNSPSITLYKDGYGLVRQPLKVQLSVGSNLITYPDLPDKLESSSVFLSMTEGEVVYQKYNTDIFDTFSYLRSSLGSSITVKTTEGKPVKGQLVDLDNRWLSIKSRNRVHVLNINEVVEVTADNPSSKPSFKPTLEWTVRSETNGSAAGEIVYISGGFDWNANYRLVIDQDEKEATLVSQAAVVNNTDHSFVSASLELVEGDLRRRRKGGRAVQMAARRTEAVASSGLQLEESGDFVLYSLPQPLTLPKNESVTISLYSDRRVKLERTYVFENNERTKSEEPLAVEISFTNGGKNLDVPLPTGTFQIYQRMADGVIFAGEDILPQTAVGDGVTLVAGRAFNVLGKRTVMNYDRKKKSEEASILLELKNHRKDKVNVRITEHIFGDWVIREPSRDYRKVDAETIQFDLTLGGGSSETITYTYRKEWQ
ncbi:MAG: hypothetical protein CMG71_03810 [Candidatus Marinimicrobia bacterium]|nr:hypothetical protein [Candidatus Neomarinimicrobiota bacterium]|tara:strand:- start:2601 stop:3929 length:1329 start_codon:yes stop_codon:yes gene_type:complete